MTTTDPYVRDSAAKHRDAGVTLVEVIVTIVMFALVTGVIASAVVVVFRSERGVVASTSEAQDTRQIVNYFPLDVASGPRDATGYRALVGGAVGDRGSACSESGDENLLRIDVSDTDRIAYHLVVPGPGSAVTSARLDRYVCRSTDGVWSPAVRVNIADSLDLAAEGAPPLHVTEVVVANPTAAPEYQRVESVIVEYVQRGRVESFSASPKPEGPYASAGVCSGQPLDATRSVSSFVLGDVTLNGTAVKSALYVGGVLTFTGTSVVAQAVPGDADAPIPPNTGLLAGSVDWAGSSGTLSMPNGYGVQIVGTEGTDFVVQTSGNGNGNGNGNGGPPNSNVEVVGPGHVQGGPTIVLQGSGTAIAGTSALPVTPADAFLDLTDCSARLAELPGSCDGTCAAHAVLPVGYVGSGSATANQTTLTLTGDLVNVLNLDESNLLDLQDDTFFFTGSGPSAGTPLIINVASDASVTFEAPVIAGQGSNTNFVIWNFPSASEVVVTGGDNVWGTLLAPFADVTSSADITGGVVARNLVMNGSGLSDQTDFEGEVGW